MSGKTVLILVLTLLFSTTYTALFIRIVTATPIQRTILDTCQDVTTAGPKTIWVPEDYSTIQEAVGEANVGDTIRVAPGTYYENLVIYKTLTLIGEDRTTTIIDGNGAGTVVDIRANNVKVSGFTIQNSGNGHGLWWDNSGVLLRESSGANITNNTISKNEYGIFLYESEYITLRENNLTDNRNGIGYLAWELSNLIHDIDTSNTINEKPIYYLVNRSNVVMDFSTFADVGFFALVNSVNITMRNFNSFEGVFLAYTKNSTIANATATWVYLAHTNDSKIENMIVSNGYGIRLLYSDHNIVTENVVMNNTWGFDLHESKRNLIYHNSFINNENQTSCDEYSINNSWDNGYPLGGNYWSDYTGVDEKSGPNQDLPESDWIGDTPYIIDKNNQDNYPLLSMFFMKTTPFEGNTVSGTITVTADVHPMSKISGIQFFIDGSLMHTDHEKPYEWSWNTTKVPDGLHTIELLAFGEAGSIAQRKVTITVDNTRPSIIITSPTDGAVLRGTVTINFTASDDNLKLAQLMLDTGIFDVTYTTNFMWDSLSVRDGNYSVIINAVDSAGNYAIASITILVDNTPPTVSIESPLDRKTIGLTHTVLAQASDLSNISRIEFYLDGVLVYIDYESPYQWEWDTIKSENREHTLIVIAYDKAGNNASDAIRVTVNNISIPFYRDPAFWPMIAALSSIGVLTYHIISYFRHEKPSTQKKEKRSKKKKKR